MENRTQFPVSAQDAPRVPGTQRVGQEAPPALPRTPRDNWQGVLDVEMRAATAWLHQAQEGMTQVEAARQVARYMPKDLRKGVTNGTLSRWQNPRNMRVAKFTVLRAVVEGLGRSMRELIEVMDTAREHYLAEQYGVSPDEVQAVARARQEEEQALLRDFRNLDNAERRVIRMQVHSLAREANRARRLAEEARAASAVAEGMPRTTDDADAALAASLQRVEAWEQSKAAPRPRERKASGQR